MIGREPGFWCHSADTGVAKFLDFLTKPENAAEWHQKTGYLPITTAAYDLTRQQGFYDKNPGADIVFFSPRTPQGLAPPMMAFCGAPFTSAS